MQDEQGNAYIDKSKSNDKNRNEKAKNLFINIWSYIVGAPYGWDGEGNEQWYYFLALVVNCMLTWWLKPELGILITICSVIHFAMTIIYGLGDLMDPLCNDKCFTYSAIYFGIHLVMFITCMCFNWWWTLITSAIVIISFLIAPDCCGFNLLSSLFNRTYGSGNDNTTGIMILHTIWFVCFAIIALLLPISIWIRIAIIVVCMSLHRFIDLYEGDCVIISDLTDEALSGIWSRIRPKE